MPLGSLIEESTGIAVKTIARFDILMLMEAVRMVPHGGDEFRGYL